MKVVVTGSRGFLGTAVMAELKRREIPCVGAPSSSLCDLLKPGHIDDLFLQTHPTAVIHCAAPYGGGGIGYANAHPFSLAGKMVRMDSLLIEAAVRYGVQKFVGIGSVCAYPESVTFPTSEDQLWLGAPEAINAPYGLAKRMQLTLLQAARKEYGLHGIQPIVANLYGPGVRFAAGLIGHVIPALIVKMAQAITEGPQTPITVWGDGMASREFLYIDDAARGVVDALQSYDRPEPINICSGAEVRIDTLVGLIATRMGFSGGLLWDTTKPNGQPRRQFSNVRARAELGWAPMVSLGEGLDRTIADYRKEAGV